MTARPLIASVPELLLARVRHARAPWGRHTRRLPGAINEARHVWGRAARERPPQEPGKIMPPGDIC